MDTFIDICTFVDIDNIQNICNKEDISNKVRRLSSILVDKFSYCHNKYINKNVMIEDIYQTLISFLEKWKYQWNPCKEEQINEFNSINTQIIQILLPLKTSHLNSFDWKSLDQDVDILEYIYHYFNYYFEHDKDSKLYLEKN